MRNTIANNQSPNHGSIFENIRRNLNNRKRIDVRRNNDNRVGCLLCACNRRFPVVYGVGVIRKIDWNPFPVDFASIWECHLLGQRCIERRIGKPAVKIPVCIVVCRNVLRLFRYGDSIIIFACCCQRFNQSTVNIDPDFYRFRVYLNRTGCKSTIRESCHNRCCACRLSPNFPIINRNNIRGRTAPFQFHPFRIFYNCR